MPRKSKAGRIPHKRVQLDGRTFDSIAESNRYRELKAQEEAGLIENLCCQDKFKLTNGYKDSKGKKHRERSYIADFTYIKDGEFVVEDVKSEISKTPVYKLKKDMMFEKYGIEIQEVLVK